MDATLYLDLDRNTLVNGLNDPSTPGLFGWMQGDTANVQLVGVRKTANDDTTTLDYYRAAVLPFTVIKLGLGYIDKAPTGGTFKLQVVGQTGNTTGALSYNATKKQVETALNALAYVTGVGGLKVVGSATLPADEVGAKNIHEIIWNDNTVTDQLAFSTIKLTPFCLTKIKTATNADLGLITVVKFFQAPLAFTQNFTYQVPPAPVIATVRSGSGSQNAIQSYSFKINSRSSCSLTYSGRSTTILPVVADATSIQASLNALYGDGVQRFSVTTQSKTYYYIEFVGPLANASQADLVVTMAENVALDAPTATLDLSGLGLEIAIAGQPRIEVVMEMEITNGSNVSTVIHAPAVILNDMIDELSVYTEPDWVLQITDPVAAVDFNGTDNNFAGITSYVASLGDGAALSFSVNHQLATLNVDVTVRESGGTNSIIPDDQYDAVITDANHILVTFAAAPAVNQFKVMILAVGTDGEHWIAHTHTSDQVTHHGDSVETILDNLGVLSSPLELWPNIPVAKLPSQIPWTNLRGAGAVGSDAGPVIPNDMLPARVALTDAQGFLPVAVIPPEVPRVDSNGLIVYGARGTDGAVTFTGFYNTTTGKFEAPVLDNLADSLAGSPLIYQAILSALQGGGVLPDGTSVIEVPDFEVTVPPVQEQKGPSVKVAVKSALTTEETVTITGSETKTTTAGTATQTVDQVTTIKVYDYLSPALVAGYVDGGIIHALPDSPADATVYLIDLDLSVRTKGPRRGRAFKAWTKMTYANRHWYEVAEIGALAYPSEMEKTIIDPIVISDVMMFKGSKLALDFVVQARLEGNVAGRAEIIVEAASIPSGVTQSLGALTWSTVFFVPILLGAGRAFHPFGMTLTRPTVTPFLINAGVSKAYGQQTALSSFTVFNTSRFALRARFTKFDFEDKFTSEDDLEAARGALSLVVKGARCHIITL